MTPRVSVVMSVYNSADSLERTLDSVLGQAGVDFELIVVDDGSTDGSGHILADRAAKDSRLRVVSQANTGLTIALANACRLASGEFIARQDAGGDVSLPERLKLQAEFMRAKPDTVMLTVATRFVGPDDETLYVVVQSDDELIRGLSTLVVSEVKGPSSHGSVMFRRDAYERVGGYRADYVVAQDIDLWLRLFELGPCRTLQNVLYQARATPGSLSSRFGEKQWLFGAAAVDAARHRRTGQPEPEFPLKDVRWTSIQGNSGDAELADLNYFFGCCMLEQNRRRARGYFAKAIRHRPLWPKAWVRWLQAWGTH